MGGAMLLNCEKSDCVIYYYYYYSYYQVTRKKLDF